MSEKAITDFFQDAWVAFHGNKDFASKYLKSLYIGDVADYKPVSIWNNSYHHQNDMLTMTKWTFLIQVILLNENMKLIL